VSHYESSTRVIYKSHMLYESRVHVVVTCPRSITGGSGATQFTITLVFPVIHSFVRIGVAVYCTSAINEYPHFLGAQTPRGMLRCSRAIELGRSYCGLHQLSEIQVSLSHIIGEPNIIFSVFNVFSDKYDN
jgi:hypothetical protein